MGEDIEITEIKQFLAEIVPFNSLSENALSKAARGIRISYFSSQSGHVEIDYDNPQLYLVRTGGFEVRDKQGNLLDRLGEGECFGYPSLLTGQNVNNKVTVLEDGLVYLLDLELFKNLRDDSAEFDRFFNRAHAKRMKRFSEPSSQDQAITQTVGSLLKNHQVISTSPQTSIEQAAQLMDQHRVSSLIITESDQLVGILTDRDIRSRVIAAGLDGKVLVNDVMTVNPSCVDRQALLFEASMLMSTHNIHHLPVIEDEKVVGMITTTDLVRAQNNQPIFLIGEINRQQHLDGLIELSKKIPGLLHSLILSDARADEIGRVLTLLSDSLTRRLLTLGETLYGEPPFAYSWIVFGSSGRMDQTAGSDQDNGMILAQQPTDEQDLYFKKLAQYVCYGLDACGYIYCPGEIMAQTDKWRVSISAWQKYFDRWINSPDPQALLHTAIFFDMRNVVGSSELFEQLQQRVLTKTKGNQIFVAAMAGNAVASKPPLGFFGKFVLERDGEENKVLDLKHRGVALINDIARIYALAEGLKEVNTSARLEQLLDRKILSNKDVKNLKDAHEFIAHMRLKNQGAQVKSGKPATNYLRPGDISALLRHQLKDAFEAVNSAQNGLKMRFTRGMF
ncbi:MAG: cyclic nucleotide-binding/CBS domain-containing protein [Gammaproteobacteria bacterium]|nr:cyclic nucleotide-binding/CBS domain-containing protein [Gammaproteobacteria bacterium]